MTDELLINDNWCDACEDFVPLRIKTCGYGRCLGNQGCGKIRVYCTECGGRLAGNCEHGW